MDDVVDNDQARRTSGGALLNPITADLVRTLRDLEDCPMMVAKHALILADGDLEAAREVLRCRVVSPITQDRLTAHQLVRASTLYTAEVGAAGERYIEELKLSGASTALPTQFRWKDLWIAMSRAARGLKPEVASSADQDAVQQSDMPDYVYGRETGRNEKVYTEASMRLVWDRLQALERIVSSTPGEASHASGKARVRP